MVESRQLHNSTNSDLVFPLTNATTLAAFLTLSQRSFRFDPFRDSFYPGGWGVRDRPLRHRLHVGFCVGSPTLTDADILSAFLTLSQRSFRFDPF
jgi:hypothetical protein